MSELTPCNYCSYLRLKERAKKEGKRLVKRKAAHGSFINGVDFHIVPEGKLPNKDNFRAWFAELPERCCC